jgi:hypothetical protein
MSTTTWAMIAYGFSAALALLLLYGSGPRRWYWHVLSAIAGLAIGLAPRRSPFPSQLNTSQGDLIIGFIFVFLFFWGAAAPFFFKRRRG